MNIEINSFGNDKIKAVQIVRDATGWGYEHSYAFVDSVDIGGVVLKDVSVNTIDELNALDADFKVVEDTVDLFSTFYTKNYDRVDNIIKEQPNLHKPHVTQYIPLVESNMISSLSREKTMDVLLEVGKIAKESEEYDLEIVVLIKQMENESYKAEELSKKFLKKIRLIRLAYILVGIWTSFILFIVCGKKIKSKINDYSKKLEEECNANAERYIWEKVVPIHNRINELYALRDDLIISGRQDWAIDVIGKDMYYSECIQDIYNLLQSRRADNLKEALNKYDDTQYKARMEEMQATIQNASEIAAGESVKQTAYAKETAKNTHRAATAARQTAYNTRQIDRNTRRFR